jgi:uncharacterized protein YecE (DUF72 family)
MKIQTVSNFYAGLSGLQLPVPKYQYPEEFQKTSRLTYYSTFFNSIEVNSSFYKIPMKSTVEKWSDSVFENFRFTFKLFKEVTHIKNLEFDPLYVDQFIHTISRIGIKKGCLLVQFPPSLTSAHISQLDKLLATIKNTDAANVWNVAVEFRNKGWYNEDLYDLLDAYNATLVQHDIPASATPLRHMSCEIVYVRFHGPTGNYRGSYTEEFLYEYATYVTEWLRAGKTVYVYFNNTAGDAFNNAIALKKYVL